MSFKLTFKSEYRDIQKDCSSKCHRVYKHQVFSSRKEASESRDKKYQMAHEGSVEMNLVKYEWTGRNPLKGKSKHIGTRTQKNTGNGAL